MGYDKDYEEYEKKETSKRHFKESECGEIEIKAEKVFITINCKEEKREKEY